MSTIKKLIIIYCNWLALFTVDSEFVLTPNITDYKTTIVLTTYQSYHLEVSESVYEGV